MFLHVVSVDHNGRVDREHPTFSDWSDDDGHFDKDKAQVRPLVDPSTFKRPLGCYAESDTNFYILEEH